jgi:hypothetical protein
MDDHFDDIFKTTRCINVESGKDFNKPNKYGKQIIRFVKLQNIILRKDFTLTFYVKKAFYKLKQKKMKTKSFVRARKRLKVLRKRCNTA